MGLTATFSSGSSASCCPRPSSSAWECFSSDLSGKAGRLRTCSLASNKEATVLEPVREGRAQLTAYSGLKSCGGDKEGSPRETCLPHSSIPPLSQPLLLPLEVKTKLSHPHGKRDDPITQKALHTAGVQWMLLIGLCYSSASPAAHSNCMNLKTNIFLLPGEQRHWQIHPGLRTRLGQKGPSIWLQEIQGPCTAIWLGSGQNSAPA